MNGTGRGKGHATAGPDPNRDGFVERGDGSYDNTSLFSITYAYI
jgi:hypothetical protein